MAMHERPNLRPVAECEWLYSSGLTVTCIMSGSRASDASTPYRRERGCAKGVRHGACGVNA
jgi:hypothetical protein